MMVIQLLWFAFNLFLSVLLAWVIILGIRSLRRYLRYSEPLKEHKTSLLGPWLRHHRLSCALTKKDVASALGGDVSASMISAWEDGISYPNDTQLIALTKIFGCSLVEIFSSMPRS